MAIFGESTPAADAIEPSRLRQMSNRELGEAAAKMLHARMATSGLMDDIFPRILKTMPLPAQEAMMEGPSGGRIHEVTAKEYTFEFGCARLSLKASPFFKKRFLGILPVADKDSWQQFTGGILDYAGGATDRPGTKTEINRYLRDHENAIALFYDKYPENAAPAMIWIARQTASLVDEVIREVFLHAGQES